ncbi:MAG: hypothetical protein DMG41_35060 [Acidobacteria bacterium]|nr:MAG: hypothetical protein AUH13_19820 [Acidobacteria bacterium 13_2_20CM_58_27]PYT65018.1 MAG: hypothetical protein DMG42_33215 [Acidobacteriota bacterium]PYT81484.1 MAG: hypothetical protein DMG41_35060 [Acidobacteriota bacterium]
MGQFVLSLTGRAEVSKEKENRKDKTYETLQMVCRKRREAFSRIKFWLQMSGKKVCYAFA